jgi:preprotein translocase subunit SecF
VDTGYDKAFSAIIDGHMTTFIAGLILAQYGSGPIKGFAVTLLVGMVASLFTSVICTRLCFDWWVRGRKVKTLDLGGLGAPGHTMEIFKHGKYYDFMGMRTFWVSLSLILTLGSVALLLIKGPNYGTDFKGGTEVELAFKKAIDVGTVRESCVKAGFAHPDVVEVSDPTNPNRFLIRVQEVSALDDAKKAALATSLCYQAEGAAAPPADRCPEGMNATELKFSPGGDKITLRYDHLPPLAKISSAISSVAGVQLRPGEGNPHVVSLRDNKVEVALKSKGDLLVDGLRQALGADVAPDSALRVEWVGPKAGKQLRDAAVKSVAIAIVFIMAYVAFRFDLRFAPGGILGLVHDSMVVIGVFVLLGKEITLSTIAAVLTIVGYSIADTVIVYDRIRENLGKHYGKSFAEIINISVSETLSRTILTSGSVLLSVSMFFIWGTGVIKDFALALVIGIIAGTYSSIYVAAPFTEWVDRRFFADKDAAKKKKKRKFVAKPAGKREAVV